MRWSKSISLVAFVLVAVLVASGVTATVWARSGGGATDHIASQSAVLDPATQPSAPPGQPAPPDLLITKVGAVSADGQTVTYTLTVTNVGGIPVMGPSVNDVMSPLPPGAQFVSATGTAWNCTGAPGPGPVNCAYPDILAPSGILPPKDQPLTITIVVAVGSGGDFGNCATVSHQSNAAVPPDSNLGNNTACVKTSVKPPPPPPPTTTYIYSVKLVCGTVTPPRPKPSIPTLRDPAPVVPGLYRTAVNIHNFWEKETTFLQKVAIALPQDQPRGPVTNKVKTSLRSNEAVEVDCYNVVAILEGTTAAKAEFLKGFVVIESPVELEVTAVYTAEELQENGISIDVEQIQPHVVRQSAAICTPGGTLSNETGIATGAPIALGAANTITATQVGTFAITLPAGVIGTAISGTAVVTGSPVALPAVAATVISVTTTGAFTVYLSCQ